VPPEATATAADATATAPGAKPCLVGSYCHRAASRRTSRRPETVLSRAGHAPEATIRSAIGHRRRERQVSFASAACQASMPTAATIGRRSRPPSRCEERPEFELSGGDGERLVQDRGAAQRAVATVRVWCRHAPLDTERPSLGDARQASNRGRRRHLAPTWRTPMHIDAGEATLRPPWCGAGPAQRAWTRI
jgi:hypothetical protein